MQAVGDLCRRHRRDFTQPGACSEAERDRIEAEIGQYVKACTANIARLEKGIPSEEQVASGKAIMNATTAAHCHGVVSGAAPTAAILHDRPDRMASRAV